MATDPARLIAAAALALLATACGGWRDRPGTTTGRGHWYTDNSGIDVATVAVDAVQPVADDVDVGARVLVDRITVRRRPVDPGDPGADGQPTGHPHHDTDAVTSASAIAGGGAVADKDRWEAQGRVAATGGSDAHPRRGWLAARLSTEPDYGAISAVAGGAVELNRRNTAVAVELGAGRDTVSPVEAPPGQGAAWPAEHHRLSASLSASQVASRDVLFSAGVAVTLQRGQLANPYRRALVRTSLFPEAVPDARDRYTGFVAAAVHVGDGTAVHLRAGGYRDSWGVWALIPEAAVVRALGDRGLATINYRFYRQGHADFWQARYHDIEPVMSGDSRLGPIRAHTTGAALRWRLRGDADAAGAWTAELGYQLAVLDFPLFATDLIIGHTATVALIGSY